MKRALLGATLAIVLAGGVLSANAAQAAVRPWLNPALTPTDRANALLAQLTEAEKLTMMHQGAGCCGVPAWTASPGWASRSSGCRTGRAASRTARSA